MHHVFSSFKNSKAFLNVHIKLLTDRLTDLPVYQPTDQTTDRPTNTSASLSTDIFND